MNIRRERRSFYGISSVGKIRIEGAGALLRGGDVWRGERVLQGVVGDDAGGGEPDRRHLHGRGDEPVRHGGYLLGRRERKSSGQGPGEAQSRGREDLDQGPVPAGRRRTRGGTVPV